ncbi:MAG: phosphodiester glycosidase family protein [Candidatus Protochlamydia sp.]|nr:phosphodiester glycosidase family protein [Candidatus Protochlamydia sp.]
MISFFKIITYLICIACIPAKMNGFTYESISNGFFTSVHILTVDPKEDLILPVRASGDEISRETVAMLADRYEASAAINGGFWKTNGDPAGILKIDSIWHGTPVKPRGAIGWSQNGQIVLIDRVLTNYHLRDCPYETRLEVIPMTSHTSAEAWSELEHIVGGTPVLVRNGNIVEDFSSEQTLESFLVNRHSRTAIGIKDSGEWVCVVIDGFYGLFGGMTINELAELMLDLGCAEAINLDGGGSSTMVLNGRVINDPCGKIRERGKHVEAVSDAILIFHGKKKLQS